MAPARPKVKCSPKPKDEASRSIPTAETQDLYNAFRKLEEEVTLKQHLQRQDLLQPPADSQVPASPQSPSCASTTYSLTHAIEGVQINEDESQGTKRRAVRHGPLDALERARAFFMRKIGACNECRGRRVKCTHFDRTFFEEQYQAQQQKLRVALLNPQAPTPSPTSQPAPPDPAPNQLVHTGSWDDFPHPATGNISGIDGAEAEIDDILKRARETPLAATVPEASFPYGIPGRLPLPLDSSAFQYPLIPQIFRDEGEDHVPIGRIIDGSIWECRHGDEAAPHLGAQIAVCHRRFSSLHDLNRHFEAEHAPLSCDWSMWKCKNSVVRGSQILSCDLLSREQFALCPQCGGYRWQQWHYGLISKAPSLTSGPSGRVMSRDGSLTGGYGEPHSQFQNPYPTSQSHFDTLWPGRWLGGQYAGSHHSYNAKPTSCRSKDQCFRRWPHYLKCRHWGRSRECSPIAPLFVISSMLLLIFLENWLWAGLSWAGSKRMRTASLTNPQNNTFWGPLSCFVAGGMLMWIFKWVRFRQGRGHEEMLYEDDLTAHESSIAQLDLENASEVRNGEMRQIQTMNFPEVR